MCRCYVNIALACWHQACSKFWKCVAKCIKFVVNCWYQYCGIWTMCRCQLDRHNKLSKNRMSTINFLRIVLCLGGWFYPIIEKSINTHTRDYFQLKNHNGHKYIGNFLKRERDLISHTYLQRRLFAMYIYIYTGIYIGACIY